MTRRKHLSISTPDDRRVEKRKAKNGRTKKNRKKRRRKKREITSINSFFLFSFHSDRITSANDDNLKILCEKLLYFNRITFECFLCIISF